MGNKWPAIGRLALGMGALAVSFWGGIHLGHLLDEGGARHAGEVAGFVVVALALYTASVFRRR